MHCKYSIILILCQSKPKQWWQGTNEWGRLICVFGLASTLKGEAYKNHFTKVGQSILS